MTLKGVQAWVTSAVDEKAVIKALILAASLRRVRTGKKLAVITTLAVSKDLRNKLKKTFDLVVLLEQDTPNGLHLEEYAKIQGFSLLVFSKCVYLSPQALVLKNCDNIFEKHGNFAIGGDEEEVDTSVYVFTPSFYISEALENITHTSSEGNFSKCFQGWMKNHVPNSEQLAREYNVRVCLSSTSNQSLDGNISIANFVDIYPLDSTEKSEQLGTLEKHAVNQCWMLYNETLTSQNILNMELSPNSSSQFSAEPIAIVGLDFRLPGANTPSEFWDLLVNGREAIRPLPPFRWTKDQTFLNCKSRKLEAGFLNIPIDEFDAKFFGVSPKDAVFLDPQQRLLHEVTWCALEEAGIDPLTLHQTKTGIFVGSWIHDYKDLIVRSVDTEFLRGYLGNSIASTAARLSHFLGTTGPCIATESGCSSAIVAVDMAIKSLRSHDSNLAMACGVNLLIHPFDQETISFIIAPDGRCKTFDAKADGFGRAEGCAVLLMKRLSDAVRDENKIWGLVRGSAVTQEGVSKSLGTPTVHCESLAMELALKDAGVQPKDVSFVEAHGTGTPVGDPLEIAAIGKTYSKGRSDPLIIGSVKTNVGHTESVSGITGIIKVLLSLKHETIPSHRNLDTLNPGINLDIIPAKIPLENLPWQREHDKPRLAGVSSFGISGTDGHVIIEEAPLIHKPQIDYKLERPLHIMKISAKTPESLDKLLEVYEHKFGEMSESDETFEDVAYSCNTGRSTFAHRAVIIATEFRKAGDIIKSKSFKQADIPSQSSPICFLFTGQGSQYPNMASSLYATSPIFRSHFDKCAQILETSFNINIKRVLFENSDELSRTLYSQTSIFCVEYCLLKLWESWGVKPDFVLGHSLGEFAAAVAAGALTLEEALMLVGERSRLIDSLPRGKMLVIRADKTNVDQHITKYKESHNPKFWADYAALNSPDQTVIAGDSEMIENFANFCKEKGLKTIILAATHAFHSRHMNPMLEEYRKIATSVTKKQVGESAPKYISGMEGKVCQAHQIDGDYWVRHTREKVSFMDACKAIQEEGCTLFLEVGPHPVLSALAMTNIDGGSAVKCLPSLRRKEDDWTTMLDSLGKLYLSDWKGEIDWKGFDQYYSRKRVDLPFYPFNRKPVWIKTRRLMPELHPLIGQIIPTASNQTVYERYMTIKNTNFVQDHMIGNTVVFPGAGFLEMTLSGGYASVQGLGEEFNMPRRAIGISNLKIVAPLALYESESCVVQTVVTLADQDEADLGYSVSIYRNNEPNDSTGGQWVLHASATFQPVPKMKIQKKINIEEIQASWKPAENKDFYEKLPEVGLRFGPKFQSLQSGWRSDDGVLIEVKVPHDSGSYLVHPVVGDAMIQAIMLWTSSGARKKLQVPARIGEFVWLSSSSESDCGRRYIYSSTNEDGGNYSLLLDGEGLPLAYMADVDFAETSVKLIEGLIQQQTTALTGLWNEIWKTSRGPFQNQIRGELNFPMELCEEREDELRKLNDIGEDNKRFSKNIGDLTHFNVLKALFKLGWRPEVDKEFTLKHLLNSLSIKDDYKYFVRFFLRSLAQQGILEMLSDDATVFKFVSEPPTFEEILENIRKASDDTDKTRVDFRLISEIGEVLHEMLAGARDPLGVLFTEDPSKANASQFYTAEAKFVEKAFLQTVNLFFVETIYKSIEEHKKMNHSEPAVLRILEVGAGTGSFSREFIRVLVENQVSAEYFYTDVSAAFFNTAEKQLGEDLKKFIVFKKFNMEEDPFEQGLCPEYFDMILACEVLHVSKDILATLKRLRSLLKPTGVIKILESVVHSPKITYVFGLLEGYWKFEDYQLRPFHPTITGEKWVDVLHEANFPRVVWRPANDGVYGCIFGFASKDVEHSLEEKGVAKNVWLVFDDGTQLGEKLQRKLAGINRKIVVCPKPQNYEEESMKTGFKSIFDDISEMGGKFEGIIYLWGLSCSKEDRDRDQKQISLPFLIISQLINGYEKAQPRLYAVTQGVCSVDDSEVRNPSSGTIRGMLGAIRNENEYLQFFHIDLSPSEEVLDQVDELFQNVWFDDGNDTVAFRDGKRFVPKLASVRISNDYLSLPSGCDRFQLQLPKVSKLISDLEFSYLEQNILEENEIEVKVKAVALNFRDVLTVLKPIADFEEFNAVGLDLAGVVTKIGGNVTKRKVGDRVIAFNTNRNLALPSHVKLEENLAISLPDKMTFGEGSTLPAVFFTSFYCLLKVAKMKEGETVLVHTASGGVGLCAIQIAKIVGANVIVTAGSQRKRNFLRNLGIKHVFHSRNTEFSKQIVEVTNGHGVDIVLNSITGPGFKEASLDCLAKSGRFVEMSKLNVWNEDDVRERRPDVFYSIIDLTQLEEVELNKLREELGRFLEEDLVKPIPFDRFDGLNIRGALNYLQKAKHIGKVVCIMPEVKVEKAKLIASTRLFNEDSTYIVTGGLGGIGFEVVKWMLNNGARHMVILSRSKPKDEIANQIESWNKSGKHVEAYSVDVGNYEQCRQLFQELQSPTSNFPPIRGVMHVAGVLQDATLDNQSWSKFEHTFNSKINGSWNLHDLTKDSFLEHFVLFSSLAAIFGPPGQANHAASNSFEDALAYHRRSIGLPATTINWGVWGEVGVATEVDFPGLRPMSTSQGLLALETFLKTQRSHGAVANIESFALLSTPFPRLKTYVDDKRLLGETKVNVAINSDEFWANVGAAEGRDEKTKVFKEFIKTTVRNMLKLESCEEIDDLTEFQELGVDSLMMLEMKNGMQNVLGTRLTITVTQLKDCSTSQLLATRLVDLLEGETDKCNLPSQEELKQLVREDSKLPEHIVPDLKSSKLIAIDQVKTVLLTGVTGNLGPYFLRDLSQRENIEKVYCLIRKSGTKDISPSSRLQSKLKSFNLLEEVNMDKVECIQGDITDELFGLSEEIYEDLAERVDAIVHSAARVDHNAKYWKAPPSRKYHVRTANVFGTQKVLEFSVKMKLKHVYYASAFGNTIDSSGQLSEDWHDVGAFDELSLTNVGYHISKHICEQLVKEAVSRGIPCKSFRIPWVGGDSRTGQCDFQMNQLYLRCLGMMKLGCMPDVPFPLPIVPVDKLVKVSLAVFFDARAAADVYHVCPRNPDVEQVLIEIAKDYGINIDVMTYPEFIERLKSIDDNSPLAPFAQRMREENLEDNNTPAARFCRKYFENCQDFFSNSKICGLYPDFEKSLESSEIVLRRDLKFIEKSGVFKKFGIGSSSI